MKNRILGIIAVIIIVLLAVGNFLLYKMLIDESLNSIEPVQFEIEKPTNLSDDEILKRAEEINERELQRQESKQQHEESKKRWLRENPPVEFLFKTDRRGDKDYVLWYLKQFSIGGDCALVWHPDVLCWDFQNGLRFPIKRPD